MSAVLELDPRPLTKAEALRQAELRARGEMLRMRALACDIAAAQIDVDAGEDTVASGMRAALLQYGRVRTRFVAQMRDVARLRLEVARV